MGAGGGDDLHVFGLNFSPRVVGVADGVRRRVQLLLGPHLESRDLRDDVTVHGLDLSPNPAGCSNPSAGKLQSSLSTAQKEGLVLMLTSAYTAGRQVGVMLSSTDCSGSSPAIYGVHVR